MTAPNQPIPNGSNQPGDFATLQGMTAEDVETSLKAGAKVSYNNAQNSHKNNVLIPIDNVNYVAVSAQGSANIAVTTAQAAANEAAEAGVKADIAYDNAHYWSVECVVSSAEVMLGVNELLLGPVLNVPDGLEARITDAHFAFITQPGGCTIEIKRWNHSGTVADVIHTQVLGANVTRLNAPALDIPVFDKERFFYNVTSIIGSTAPTVMQINVSGVYYPEEP